MSHPSSRSPAEAPPGHVLPAFPLTLLERVRAHDRPDEVLEDEDLMQSMPRRLGLTGVVFTQIRRYEEAERAGKPVPYGDVISLIQLVLRRPDAGIILWETGQAMAQRRLARVPGAMIRLARLMPGHGTASAARVGRRLLRALSGGGSIESHGRPFRVAFNDCPLATLDALGTGCSLYTGALETLVRGYSGRETKIVHEHCRGRGEDACVWSEALEEPSTDAA
jgi:hypothetical protein